MEIHSTTPTLTSPNRTVPTVRADTLQAKRFIYKFAKLAGSDVISIAITTTLNVLVYLYAQPEFVNKLNVLIFHILKAMTL